MGLVVGLTGGIGSGKSTVADLLHERGACIIDTDEISHRLTAAGGEAIPAIARAFGNDYITATGSLDRARMRQAIFSDARAKEKLEAILHPRILASVQEQLSCAGNCPYVVIVVPLLFDSPAYLRLVQRILVVDCDEQQQVERVMRRSGLSEDEVRAIMSRQTRREERLRRADDVIINAGDLASLVDRVDVLHARYFSAKPQNGD